MVNEPVTTDWITPDAVNQYDSIAEAPTRPVTLVSKRMVKIPAPPGTVGVPFQIVPIAGVVLPLDHVYVAGALPSHVHSNVTPVGVVATDCSSTNVTVMSTRFP
jgi:hypothetical protein